MKLADLLAGIGYTLVSGTVERDIQAVTIDSRKAGAGALFVCIKGLRADGHLFAESAFKQGAAAILCDRALAFSSPGCTVIRVDDTREALASIAAAFYQEPARALRLIGVTGTNGKTSITYFLESILQAYGRKTGVIGTVSIRADGEVLPYQLETSTTPDAMELQRIFRDMKARHITDVVMEVSSHALALHKVLGCTFEVSVFTNLTGDHLDFHGTMEAYGRAKAKLFTMSHNAVVNNDDASAALMTKDSGAAIITYGIEQNSDIKAENIIYSADGVRFSVMMNGQSVWFTLPVPGRFSLYNALGAIGAAMALHIPADVIQKGIAAVKPVPGRIQSIPNDLGFGVIVDYAHTPDGLANILRAVREFTAGRCITVFGCGGDRDRTKRPEMGRIAGRLSDFTVITSDNPRSEEPDAIIDEIEQGMISVTKAYTREADRREAIFQAIELAGPGDCVIIAGKGHETYEIFADRTIDFDDTLVAREALTRKASERITE